MNKRLWHLIVGTRGGLNRARIIVLLRERARNANEIAAALELDYKTVRHHLRTLQDNDVVMSRGQDAYGTTYELAPRLQVHYEEFEEIWMKIGEK